MYNVLVCDDEKDIVSALEIYLSAEGYNIYKAYNGIEALKIIEEEEIHLVLLDIMMPVMDGIKTLNRIRETSNVPVIFLTAKGEDTDKIAGLNIGADDYVTKPFNPVELTARVRSNLRRFMQLGGNNSPADGVYKIAGIVLDVRSHTVTRDGDSITLTPTEYEILKLFMMNPDTLLTPQKIYEEVWGNSYMGSDSIVAVHIRHLREKLEYDPSDPRFLRVVWGQGYKLCKKQGD